MVNKLSRKSNLAKLFLMLIMALCLAGTAVAEGGATALTWQEYQDVVSTYSINKEILDYTDYLEKHEDAARPDAVVTVEADTFVRYEDAGAAVQPEIRADYEVGEDGLGKGNAVLTGEESLIEWTVSVPESGLYDLSILYYPVAGKNSAIQRAIFIDGQLPYGELALVEFYRVWSNGDFPMKTDENGVVVREWDSDTQGNNLKPSAKEIPEWVSVGLQRLHPRAAERVSGGGRAYPEPAGHARADADPLHHPAEHRAPRALCRGEGGG